METNNTQPIFPWYKERLQVKYLKTQAIKTSSVGRFVNVDLDNFSDCSSLLSRDQSGVAPVFFRDTLKNTSGQKSRKCNSKENACFSKHIIQKQIRREYVAAVEEKLKQHPLFTFPHYKNHMTPELFYKVVAVLDPGMIASALPTPTGEHTEEENEENCTEPSHEETAKKKKLNLFQ